LRNIRLTLAYEGTDFHGWQRQPRQLTIQACLEEATGRIVGAPVTIWGSGRTDAGVHALNQVANFKTDSPIPVDNLVKALNGLLPPTVRIKEACDVPETFHARHDARSKTYRYRILQAPICSPFLWRFVCHHPYPLDRARMARAARLVEGERDFTSFAAVESESRRLQSGQTREAERLKRETETGNWNLETGYTKWPSGSSGIRNRESEIEDPDPQHPSDSPSMVRTILTSRVLWCPRTSILIYEVCGSGFLHHMVRNIVGTLMEVGRGKLEPQEITRIMERRDRTQAGPTAPAQGLCLVRVDY